MVVVPARLSYPSMEKVCMDLSNVKSSMLLTITLETKIKTYKLLDRFIWERRQLKCFSFPVSVCGTFKSCGLDAGVLVELPHCLAWLMHLCEDFYWCDWYRRACLGIQIPVVTY